MLPNSTPTVSGSEPFEFRQPCARTMIKTSLTREPHNGKPRVVGPPSPSTAASVPHPACDERADVLVVRAPAVAGVKSDLQRQRLADTRPADERDEASRSAPLPTAPRGASVM